MVLDKARFIAFACAVAICGFCASTQAEEAVEKKTTNKNPLQLLGTAPVEKDANGSPSKVEATPALFGRRWCGGFRSGGYYGYPSYYGNYGVRQYGYGYPGVGTAYYNPVHGNDHTNYGGGYGYNQYGANAYSGNAYSGNYSNNYNNYGYGNNYGYNNYGNYPNYNNYGYNNNGYGNYNNYGYGYNNGYNNYGNNYGYNNNYGGGYAPNYGGNNYNYHYNRQGAGR